MLIAWRLTRGQRRAPLAFALFATGGFTTIFYGHIETYAQPVALLLLHLLAVHRTARRRWPPWTVAATFSLVMAFHLVIIFALPAVLAVLYLEVGRSCREWPKPESSQLPYHRKKPLSARAAWLSVFLAFLPGVILWYVVSLGLLGEGELIGPHFSVPPAELPSRPWILFTQPALPFKLRFAWWNGGAAAFAAVWLFARTLARPRRDPYLFYLFLYFICFIGFTLLWNPDASDRDFDLFCFPWVVACLAVARGWRRLPWRPVAVALILAVNAWLFVTRTVAFADLQHRGSGAIIFTSVYPFPDLLVRMDNGIQLYPVNRHVPAGSHEILVREGQRLLRTTIDLRDGQTCRLRLDAAGLSME